MKSFALLCFLVLALACVFVVRADEKTLDVDAPKIEDLPETADEIGDEEETDADESEPDSGGEETESEGANEEKEIEEDEETNDVANDHPVEKRRCRTYRRGKLWCKACGCIRSCRTCLRRVCYRRRCYKRICHVRFGRRYCKTVLSYCSRCIIRRVSCHCVVKCLSHRCFRG